MPVEQDTHRSNMQRTQGNTPCPCVGQRSRRVREQHTVASGHRTRTALPSSQATLDQVPFQRQFDGLTLAVDAELAQDGMQMVADRGIADTERIGHLTGRLALHQER